MVRVHLNRLKAGLSTRLRHGVPRAQLRSMLDWLTCRDDLPLRVLVDCTGDPELYEVGWGLGGGYYSAYKVGEDLNEYE